MSPAQTREELLRAAGRVFARAGYDGATVAEIAAEAGVSTGAIYVHYDGKAGLFSAVLRAHVQHELSRRLRDGASADIGDLITDLGADLDRRPAAERTLLIEAVMAAKHDEKTRAALSGWFTDRHEFIAEGIADAQRDGQARADFSPMAAARFATAVMLGTMVLDVLDVPQVGHEDWAGFVAAVVDAFRS